MRVPLGAVRGLRRGRSGSFGHGSSDWSFLLRRGGGGGSNGRRCNSGRLGGFGGRGCNNGRHGRFSRRRCGGERGSFRSCCRGRDWDCSRLGGCLLLCGVWMSFTDSRGSGRLDHHGHGGRRNGDCRTRCNHSACRSFGDDRANGRARGNSGRRWRRGDDGRRGAGLGNDLARFRACRRGGRRRNGDHWRRWPSRGRPCWRSGRRNGGLRGRMAVPRFRFLFLLFGQDGLQYVARLGDMREIDFGHNALWGTRRL